MLIKLTYDNKEPYEARIKNDDSFTISILNAIYVDPEDTVPSGTAPDGGLQLEIKDNFGQEVSIEDKITLYDLYSTLRTTVADVTDFAIYNEVSGNLLFSTQAFGYNIKNVGFLNFILNPVQEQENNSNKTIFLQLILTPKLKIKVE